MGKKARFLFCVCLALCLSVYGKVCLAVFPSQPTFTIEDVAFPLWIEAGDLNGDSKPDLVVSSWVKLGESYDIDQSKICIFYQNKGEYPSQPDKTLSFAPNGLPRACAVGDFDNDGKGDLAVSSAGQFLCLFLGKEGLSVNHKFYDINDYISTQRPSFGKMSKDGIMDFLVGPVWRKWMGGDKIQHGYFYGAKVNDANPGLLADLNKDGALDAVFRRTNENVITIYYGPFSNMLVKTADLSEYVELSAPLRVGDIAVGDLNGDGRPDIIASSAWNNDPGQRQIFIYYQNVPIGFAANAEPSAVIEGITGGIAVADFNKDGLTDFVVAEGAGDNPRTCIFYQKKGKGFARSADEASETISDYLAYSFKVVDINGDGYPDIVTTSVNENIVRGFIQTQKK